MTVRKDGELSVTDGRHTSAVENDGSGNPIYIGLAAPGTLKSAAKWQIRKLTWVVADLTDVQYANGSADFAAVWNDRAALSYS